MKPFKVTFDFAAPVCRESEYPLHLDALIAYGVMKEHEEMGEENPWEASSDLSGYLAKSEGEEWCWKASWVKMEALDNVQFINTIRKCEPDRIYDGMNEGLWLPKGGKLTEKRQATFSVNTRSGQLRGYQWLLPVQWVRGVAWGVGNIEDVEFLLQSRIHYLGKQTRNGYGRIKSITVTEAPAAEANHWMYRCMPVMPEKAPFMYAPVMGTVRPPYWKKTERMPAFEPVE